MKKFNSSAYKITIQETEVDGASRFVATALEFPDLVVFEDTYIEAYEAIASVIGDLQADFAADGKPFPTPAPNLPQRWSGRVTLRIPKTMHMKAAKLAESEGVSLNQFLVSTVAETVGGKIEKASEHFQQRHMAILTHMVTTFINGQTSYAENATAPFKFPPAVQALINPTYTNPTASVTSQQSTALSWL